MSGYEKETFSKGQILTADAMNNIITGIEEIFARLTEIEEQLNIQPEDTEPTSNNNSSSELTESTSDNEEQTQTPSE